MELETNDLAPPALFSQGRTICKNHLLPDEAFDGSLRKFPQSFFSDLFIEISFLSERLLERKNFLSNNDKSVPSTTAKSTFSQSQLAASLNCDYLSQFTSEKSIVDDALRYLKKISCSSIGCEAAISLSNSKSNMARTFRSFFENLMKDVNPATIRLALKYVEEKPTSELQRALSYLDELNNLKYRSSIQHNSKTSLDSTNLLFSLLPQNSNSLSRNNSIDILLESLNGYNDSNRSNLVQDQRDPTINISKKQLESLEMLASLVDLLTDEPVPRKKTKFSNAMDKSDTNGQSSEIGRPLSPPPTTNRIVANSRPLSQDESNIDSPSIQDNRTESMVECVTESNRCCEKSEEYFLPDPVLFGIRSLRDEDSFKRSLNSTFAMINCDDLDRNENECIRRFRDCIDCMDRESPNLSRTETRKQTVLFEALSVIARHNSDIDSSTSDFNELERDNNWLESILQGSEQSFQTISQSSELRNAIRFLQNI